MKHTMLLLMVRFSVVSLCTSACAPLDDSATTGAVSLKNRNSQDKVGTTKPIRALYLTDYSSFWHNYKYQQDVLRRGISEHLNIEFDLVGKHPDDTRRLMKQDHFSAGYDVVIYNMCFANDLDTDRIDNIISQTRDLGVPAVLLHCAMHSFRNTSPSQPFNPRKLMTAEWEWERDNPGSDFPYWWHFTGVDTTGHDLARALRAERVDTKHPITKGLPDRIETNRDELYQNLAVRDDVIPLYSAYSTQGRRHHLVAWTHDIGAGRVFATTLGHDRHTLALPEFHKLIAHGIAYLTEHMDEDGAIEPGYRGNEETTNYQSTVTCNPGDVIEATTIGEVQQAVRRAAQSDRPLKVVSLNKSNSNTGFICPDQGGILLNLWKMDQVIDLNTNDRTVTVQPGIRATNLSKYLSDNGFAIPAMPDYTGVSIAGGIATAAHHSSLQIPSSMADMVQSIKIVDGRGRLRRFNGRKAAQASVHLGMLGVVVEVTLAIEPQFKLKYGHEKGRDTDLENNIENMVRQHPYARVMWFAGNGRYVLDYYDRVDSETEGNSEHNLWTSSGSVFRWVGDIPYRVLNEAPLRAQCDSALIRSKVWLAPFNKKDTQGRSPIGLSHKMLGSYCEPGRCPWDTESVKSYTLEAAFPLRRLKEWMGDVREIIAENRACFPILGIYLRFSKGSDRWMGFNYGEDTVAFEIHVPKVADETAYERSAAVYNEILQLTLHKYDGRPHWGKNSSSSFVGLGSAQYPRWNDFIRLKNQLDPDGRFDNKLWRQMTREEAIEPYPGCALSQDCVCQQDSDCGYGYTCVPGGFYADARVCR